MNSFEDLSEFIAFLKNEAETCLLAEICAMVGLDEQNKIIYQQMQNRSKNPDGYFMIDPYDYLNFIKKYKPLAVFHSHLVGDESPSEFDEKTSENCCFPFVIYSVCSEKFCIYEPHYKDYDVNIIQRLKESI